MNSFIDFIKAKKIFLIVGLIILIIVYGILISNKKSDVTETYLVKTGNLVNILQVNGKYQIASQTEVVSPANGIVTKLYVKNNETVKKGDNLFYVESTATPEEKAKAYTDYLTSKSQLDADNAGLYSQQSAMYSTWKIFTDLATNSTYENSDKSPKTSSRSLTEFTTAQDNWLAAEANYKNQQGLVVKDQSALYSATLAYQATQNITVTAQANGTVANLQKKVGDQVSILTATNNIPPVLIIADFDNPTIMITVSEENVPRVAIGQKAEIVFDAIPDKKFSGTVESIDSIGVENQGEVSYRVRIKAEDITSDVRPNMTANVNIETVHKDDVIIIPNSAVIERDSNAFVQKIQSGKPKETLIELGDKGLIMTEVKKGLSVGDKIVVPK
jgi:membrane fusion protein, macrolide-specific efflux system